MGVKFDWSQIRNDFKMSGDRPPPPKIKQHSKKMVIMKLTVQMLMGYFNKLSVEAVQYPVVIRIDKDGRQLEYEIRDVYIYVDNNKKKLILYVKTDN